MAAQDKKKKFRLFKKIASNNVGDFISTNINLLPQDEFSSSLAGRTLKWILTTFRYIVIAVEIVVITAFLSRFYFDARITDLKDEIKQKTAILTSSSAFEKRIRYAQRKIEIYNSFANRTKESDKISEIVTHLPQEVNLSQISAKEKSTRVEGTSFTESGITQLIANLGSINSVESANLIELSGGNSDNPIFSFTLLIDYP